MNTINIYPDGNQMCAIIGEMPEEIAVGFGDTAIDAIKQMLIEIEIRDYICKQCLQKANEIYEHNLETQYECPDGHKWTIKI